MGPHGALPPRNPWPRAAVGAMDPALAAQKGEAVAQKVLQYRRDESGWKICREGVSEELGGQGPEALAPGAGDREPYAPRLLSSRWLRVHSSPGRRGPAETAGQGGGSP